MSENLKERKGYLTTELFFIPTMAVGQRQLFFQFQIVGICIIFDEHRKFLA